MTNVAPRPSPALSAVAVPPCASASLVQLTNDTRLGLAWKAC